MKLISRVFSPLRWFWSLLFDDDPDLTPHQQWLADELRKAEKEGRIHIDRDGLVSMNPEHPDVKAKMQAQIDALAQMRVR
ncbi:hypothetical protein KF397_005077 [Salmonella enterica subsp. enterica serovar Oranienburg]|nr:hypothetical protein [Salmonella enterica subsp. enterica serovar Oranienburg]